MSKEMKKNKKTPIWCYVTILIIAIMAINIQVTSTVTKNVVERKMENVAEMVITKDVEFTELQTFFQNRYKADGSVTYLLQPKDYIKLYKQAVSIQVNDTTSHLYVPTKVNLKDEIDFQKEIKEKRFVRMDSTSKFKNIFLLKQNQNYKSLYVFPIYHYDIHVAELYLFFNETVILSEKEITTISSEIQPLSRLIE